MQNQDRHPILQHSTWARWPYSYSTSSSITRLIRSTSFVSMTGACRSLGLNTIVSRLFPPGSSLRLLKKPLLRIAGSCEFYTAAMQQIDSCFQALETVLLVERVGANDRLPNKLAGWAEFEYGWDSDCDHDEVEVYDDLIRH